MEQKQLEKEVNQAIVNMRGDRKYRTMTIRTCEGCGIEFEVSLSEVKNGSL